MRLLDLIAQCRDPLIIMPRTPREQPVRVCGPTTSRTPSFECPLRFVIGDDLTRRQRRIGIWAMATGWRLSRLTQNSGAALVGRVERCCTPTGHLRVWHRAATGSGCERAPGGVLREHRRRGALRRRELFGARRHLTGNAKRKCRPWRPTSTSMTGFAPTVDPDAMLRGRYASVTHAGVLELRDLLGRVRFALTIDG